MFITLSLILDYYLLIHTSNPNKQIRSVLNFVIRMMARVMMLLSLTSLTKAFNMIPQSLSSKTSLSKTSLSSSDIQSEIAPAFYGLLAGFTRQPNITSFSEICYTDKLNLAACKEEFSKEDILWRTFMQDMKPEDSPAAITESISRAAKEFINSDFLCDRGEIIEYLKTIEKGDMVIVTGGPSTGKSLVLKHLFANDSKYLYLDGRKTPNILKALSIIFLNVTIFVSRVAIQ